jgi:hypothetical protein
MGFFRERMGKNMVFSEESDIVPLLYAKSGVISDLFLRVFLQPLPPPQQSLQEAFSF